jgi:hypothetical protein
MNTQELVICTLASRQFFPMVRLLEESLHDHHPNLKLILASGDTWKTPLPSLSSKFEHRKVSIPSWPESRRFYYSRIKPRVINGLLEEGFENVIYLDPDMLVVSSLTEVFNEVTKHQMTLTPHILKIEEDRALVDLDRVILRAGIFNAGFVGASNTDQTREFLRWWQSRAEQRSFDLTGTGLDFDQRWLDLAPGFLGDLKILPDPGVNLAYFNAAARRIERTGDSIDVDGSKLKLIHFSGFRPDNLPSSNIYYPERTIDGFGELAELFQGYSKRLSALNFNPDDRPIVRPMRHLSYRIWVRSKGWRHLIRRVSARLNAES